MARARTTVRPVALARRRGDAAGPARALAPPPVDVRPHELFSAGDPSPADEAPPSAVGSAGLSYSEVYDQLWATGEPLDVKRVRCA
jgi:hypothetical protein